MDDRAELRAILRANSVLRGRFILASGKVSDYYLDCKRTTLDSPRGLELTCKIILDRIKSMRPRPHAIGGLTIGAAPISIGVSQMALRLFEWSLPVFVVRDEQKSHGTQRMIEGELRHGWNVVIVDDVMTTGNSVLKAINAVKDQGATIARVFILVDREEGGRDSLKDYEVESLFSYKELQDD